MTNKCSNCECESKDLSNWILITLDYDKIPEHYQLLTKEIRESIEYNKAYHKEHNNPNVVWPPIKQIYCGYCGPYFQELEIQRIGGVSMKNLESKETFTDFIEASRQWHQRQLVEKDQEILKLQLQLKEKENEVLTWKLKGFELQLKSLTAENKLDELSLETTENILQFSELQTTDFNLNE